MEAYREHLLEQVAEKQDYLKALEFGIRSLVEGEPDYLQRKSYLRSEVVRTIRSLQTVKRMLGPDRHIRVTSENVPGMVVVRLLRGGKTVNGIVCMPVEATHHSRGGQVAAATIANGEEYPPQTALSLAMDLYLMIPEVASIGVRLEDGVTWNPEWGTLD